MMLYPPMSELVDKVGSRYLLVNLVARRAREISSIADSEEIPLEKKPVSSAINEVYTGKLSVAEGAEFEEEDAAEIAGEENIDF